VLHKHNRCYEIDELFQLTHNIYQQWHQNNTKGGYGPEEMSLLTKGFFLDGAYYLNNRYYMTRIQVKISSV
jgi:hypothetical protein